MRGNNITTVAEQLLKLLGEHGIEHLFLNPGTDSAPLQEAMKTLPAAGIVIPKVHSSTFEAVSLAAAHAYYQATGRPACVFVHVDAGTQNLGAMMHDALRDRAGVIILAGRTPYAERDDNRAGRTGYIQWLQDVPDQPGIVRGYTKLAIEVARPSMLGRAIGRAVQLATAYPAGPVYVTLSRDVLMDPLDPEASRSTGFAVPAPAALSASSVEDLAKLVGRAERPVLVTSRVGRRPEGVAATVRLAERTGLTVVRGVDTGPMSIPTLHPAHRRSPVAVGQALREADLVLVVECDVPWIPRAVELDPEATVVHIDPEPLKASMPLWAYPVDLALTADGPVALGQLADASEALAASDHEVADRFDGRLRALQVEQLPDPGKEEQLEPLDVLLALNEVLREDDVVVEEAVTNSGLFYQSLVRSRPGTIAGGFAPGLGWALGGSIGVKLARPERRVVAVLGDGSFLFGVPSSALMMAAGLGAPFLAVVLNNGGYRASRLPVYDLFPEGASAKDADAVGTRFTTAPDFAALARSCRAFGERVEVRSDLRPTLRRAIDAVDGGQAAVLDVAVHQN